MGRSFRLVFLLVFSCHCIFIGAYGFAVNLRVSELGTDTVSVIWSSSQKDRQFSFQPRISPVDEGESASPQVFNNTYAMWKNLVPGKTYTVKVGYGSKTSLPALLKITTVPDSPTNMNIKKFINPIMTQFRVTGTKTIMYPVYGAVVSWDQPEGGHYDDFFLTIDPAHGSIRVPVKLKSGMPAQRNTEPSRIVWDLLPGVLYEFTVQSKSNSIFSNPLTGTERMPPDTPGPITVEETAPTFVTLAWDGEHRGILDGYAVETHPEGGIPVQVHDDPTHPKRRIENLTPGTKYKIEVFSTMDGLRSFKPRVIDVKTPPAAPRKEIVSEEVRSESVFITWNPPPGSMDYYEIIYFPTDRDFGRLRQRVWEPRINLTVLDPGKAYQTEIYAISNELTSDPLKAIVYTRPLPPNAVITTATQDTIEISWETQHDDGAAVITIRSDDGEVITKRIDEGIEEFSVTGLDPGTDYVITLFTITNGVESDPVNQTITTTPKPSSDNVPNLPEVQATEKDSTNTTAVPVTTIKIEALEEETSAEPKTFRTTVPSLSTTGSERVSTDLPTTAETSSKPAAVTTQDNIVYTTRSFKSTTIRVRREETTQSLRTLAERVGTITTKQQSKPSLLPTTIELSVATTTQERTTAEQKTAFVSQALRSSTTASSAEPKKELSTTSSATTSSAAVNEYTDSTDPMTTYTTRSENEITASRTNTQNSTTQRISSSTTVIDVQNQATSSPTMREKTTTLFTLLPPTEKTVPPSDVRELSTTVAITAPNEVAPTLDNTIIDQENSTTLETISINQGFQTFCSPNNITVLVDKAIIAKYEEQYGPLHFNQDDGQNCRGVEHEGYYRYTIAPNILGCGTELTVNDTHVNFTNTVSNRQQHEEWYKDMLDDSGNIMIGHSDIEPYPLILMNFHCTFPVEMTVHTDLIPQLRVNILKFNVSGVGEFSAVMQLFEDDKYRHPYFGSPSIDMDDRLRVGVTLLHTRDDSITIAVKKCWATPVRDPDYSQFYPLIDEYCPLNSALNGKLVILENGKSKRSRWEGPVFKFVNFAAVWLHCEVKVCFHDQCNKVCSKRGGVRKRRGFANPATREAVVSTGPIIRKPSKDKLEEKDASSDAENSKLEETIIIIIVSVLSAIVLILCVLFVLLFTKCRHRSRRDKEKEVITRPDSVASFTLDSRNGDMWKTGRYAVTTSPVHRLSGNPDMSSTPRVLESGHSPETLDAYAENNCYINPSMTITEEMR